MKEGRRAGGITAGPESKVLEGLTWEEARNLQEAQRVYVGDNVDFKVGAASKGIIQRDFQHHATVFRFVSGHVDWLYTGLDLNDLKLLGPSSQSVSVSQPFLVRGSLTKLWRYPEAPLVAVIGIKIKEL